MVQMEQSEPRQWRINRNIVECKLSILSKISQTSFELIETLWNVNVCLVVNLFFAVQELIETLWNVNDRTAHTIRREPSELIETLWNVNVITNVFPDKSISN